MDVIILMCNLKERKNAKTEDLWDEKSGINALCMVSQGKSKEQMKCLLYIKEALDMTARELD